MKYLIAICAGVLTAMFSAAQIKKPIDHSVYDQWQSVSALQVSNNGQWVVYQVIPQEGDGELVIRSADGRYTKVIARGSNPVITDDNRFVVCRIRPHFADMRDARIKKKKPEDMPKDSMAVLQLGTDSIWKQPRVKSFRLPDDSGNWLAYHLEKALPEPAKPAVRPDSLTRINRMAAMADSLQRVADSIRNKANEARQKGLTVLEVPARNNQQAPRTAIEPIEEGTVLVLRNLVSGEEQRFSLVSEFMFSKNGAALIVETTRKNNDTTVKPLILWVHTQSNKIDTVLRRFNDAKNYAIDESASQLAFVAERDSVAKALKKYYKLWYYKPGMDSAIIRAAKGGYGLAAGKVVSPDFPNRFSKDGTRLLLGIAPERQPKDTTLVEFETARLDIWHYNDDYLQPQQLVQLNQDLRRSYLATLSTDATQVLPLADEDLETIQTADDDNAPVALGSTTKGYRVEGQWNLRGNQDIYLVDMKTGARKLIARKVRGGGRLSPKANYVYWYDWTKRHYMIYNIAKNTIINATQTIKVPLWDEEDDHPDDPPPHGFMGWHEHDAFFYVYDRFDIWKVDPTGNTQPVCFTEGIGRARQVRFRYVLTDREERSLKDHAPLMISVFDTREKRNGFLLCRIHEAFAPHATAVNLQPNVFASFQKAKNASVFAYTQSSFNQSPDVHVSVVRDSVLQQVAGKTVTRYNMQQPIRLSFINPQQSNFNWYTVELHRWKMFDGKMSEGLLFKPENFDSTKKYPVIFYFYERNADGRYNYRPPAPSASTVNIAYFVSNGYLVFDPNIYYKNGEPGESAYNSVVSAAKYLSKMKFVDSTKMAIQGQSWGGYQVAYLITRTNLFAAAGAGAPVANMFSAYGGIRWGTGISRQFQYERTQSRIGYTPWQRPDLYTKNSPLFKADKVNTPLLMMHNDKDGAVPWYQGIEYFTALRRLGKKVWMLQYNDEDHNLVERRNRKDLSVRLAQFFDHYLKGAPMPVWMKEGVPAVNKGIDWGLDIKRH